MKDLVIVESPTKAKTINKYLGRNFTVEATVGHVRDLPKTKLGVDIEHGFVPELLNIRGKGDVIKKIRDKASKSGNIYIATDPDREGEAIACDIYELIKGKTKGNIYRVLFPEITKDTVKKAIKSPKEIDDLMVASQRARRVVDRIIGYKISPILWQAIVENGGSSLSAGRVQSVALRLICEREEEIENFKSSEYWTISALYKTAKGEEIKSSLAEIDGRPLRIFPIEADALGIAEFNKKYIAIRDKKTADEMLEDIKLKKEHIVSSISRKETKRNPYPPFITSSLQQEASRRLRLRPRETMRIAQSLYEGLEIGDEGFTGLITYMRTDSTRLNEDVVNEARSFISEKFGPSYCPKNSRNYDNKKKNVQDAHEAIRPTSVRYTPDMVKPYLKEEQFALYKLIWNRFIACQMSSAVLDTTTLSISASGYLFKTSGTIVKFDGFMALYEEAKEDQGKEEPYENQLLPVLKEGERLGLGAIESGQHFTKPPARFSESTLIKELEANGIGRPSTYATIVGTIQDREYVEIIERKIRPTGLGREVNSVLVKNFPKILNVHFTAGMEDDLDGIAQGEKPYGAVLTGFYSSFSTALAEVEKNVEKILCDKCGSPMEIKVGRFGKYLACSNYPECKNIKSMKKGPQEKREPEYTGETCPKCGGRTMFRVSRYGRFIGCEKYPECDYNAQIKIDAKCPKCGGDVVQRRSKKGRSFYGCSNYPKCDFVSWTNPASKKEETKEDPIEKE